MAFALPGDGAGHGPRSSSTDGDQIGAASGDPCQTFLAFCEPFFLCRGEAVRSCVYLLLVTQKKLS